MPEDAVKYCVLWLRRRSRRLLPSEVPEQNGSGGKSVLVKAWTEKALVEGGGNAGAKRRKDKWTCSRNIERLAPPCNIGFSAICAGNVNNNSQAHLHADSIIK